jgi:thioredoxin 1
VAGSTPLTDSTFWPFVREHKLVVVHFWAVWNGTDRLMRTFLENLPAEIGDLIEIGTLDTDVPAHWDLIRSHRCLNLPFLVFYRDGVLVSSVLGLNRQKILESLGVLVA